MIVNDYHMPDDDRHFQSQFRNGRYQGGARDLALSACRQFRCAVDVGAHVGTWARELMEHFESVHAFEPIRSNYDQLVKNVPGACLHAVALGRSRSFYPMKQVKPGNSGTWAISDQGQGMEVRVNTLDAYDIPADFIKIDAEGSEYDVLSGSVDTIRQMRPVLCIEIRSPEELAAHGYPVRYRHDDLLALLADLGMIELGRVSADVVYIPEEWA